MVCRDAWSEFKGLESDEAKNRYIQTLSSIDSNWRESSDKRGEDGDKVQKKSGEGGGGGGGVMGVSVSVLSQEEEDGGEDEMIFELCSSNDQLNEVIKIR